MKRIQNLKFKIQNYNAKVKTLILFTLTFAFCILTFYFTLPTFAQSCPTQSTNPRVQNGLISTPDISGSQNISGINKFSNPSGICATGNAKISFAPYKIPSYEDLKSLYYTQAKSPVRKNQVVGSPTQEQFTSVFTSNDVILVSGDLPDLRYTGTTKPTVVFVEGNLSISNNITYGDENSGIVFVVQDNVIIDQSVTQIDAVIISSGKIYTAGSCSHTSPVPASQLVINGSLISLDESNTIEFCRTLGTNNDATPAEVINNKPKYLVILKDLFADTLQKWSELTDFTPPAPVCLLINSTCTSDTDCCTKKCARARHARVSISRVSICQPNP